jgi:hypothetical protein
MVFIALNSIDNIIGQKFGIYYATNMVNTEVALQLQWNDQDWCEDHNFFQRLQKTPEFSKKIIQTAEMYYVVRRHEERYICKVSNLYST